MQVIKGYKATDSNMQCRGYQFVLGEWATPVEGELSLCQNGYHFCKQPSGVWAYYSSPGTRVFEVEAVDVLPSTREAGANTKEVCRSLRLIREVLVGGDWNTGNWNTGDGNTGNWNTGDGNTGNRNTGDGNTGNRNTGDRNTGNRNTGDRNTGDGNTGDGNTANYCSGFFCQNEPNVLCFDVDSKLSRLDFVREFSEQIWWLQRALDSSEPITEFRHFSGLPGFTPEKLASLHAKHLAARKVLENDQV